LIGVSQVHLSVKFLGKMLKRASGIYMKYRKGMSDMSRLQKSNEMNIYGTVKVGERGQIVIPSKAREEFSIKPGDLLLVFSGRRRGGIALVKADAMKDFATRILKGLEEEIRE
jgi:AbrB family looped-hinge helix DNA binding protein